MTWCYAAARVTRRECACRSSRASQRTGHDVCLKDADEEEQMRFKARRRQEISKIGTHINATENRNTIEQISDTKNWFFFKINKIDKPLDRMVKKTTKQLPISRMGELT